MAVFGDSGGTNAVTSDFRVGIFNSKNLQQKKKIRSLSSKMRLI